MSNCLDCNIELPKDREHERCDSCLYRFIFAEDLQDIDEYVKGDITLKEYKERNPDG